MQERTDGQGGDNKLDEFDVPKIDEHIFNDDLLLPEADRLRAKNLYPSIYKALDFEDLRKLFDGYDKKANAAKARSRRAGCMAVVFGTVALLGLVFSPVLNQFQPGLGDASSKVFAVFGIASVVIGVWGVLYAGDKRRWLLQRMMTERLRQFHFQYLVREIGDVLGTAQACSDEAWLEFQNRRAKWFEAFKDRYGKNAYAYFDSLIKDTGMREMWLHERAETSPLKEAPQVLEQFFDAYRSLRILHQKHYADYKLRRGGPPFRMPLKKQWLFFDKTAFLLVMGLFGIHMLEALWGFWGHAGSHGGSTESFVRVIGLAIAILALSFRALEEGLGLGKELERYRDYSALLENILQRFDDASTVAGKLDIMEEMERISFEEMRSFLRSQEDARFVM